MISAQQLIEYLMLQGVTVDSSEDRLFTDVKIRRNGIRVMARFHKDFGGPFAVATITENYRETERLNDVFAALGVEPLADTSATSLPKADPTAAYYTLIPAVLAPGSVIGADPDNTFVVADPRQMPVGEMTDKWGGEYISAATEIIENAALTLVRVEPVGDVEGPDDYDHTFRAPGGWTVTGIEPTTDAVLGPQGARVREVAVLAEQVLNAGDDNPLATEYAEMVNDRIDAVKPHEAAAEDALQRIGADGFYWGTCVYGWEMLALAARDLIGTTPLWTQEAYDALTEPWRLVMQLPAHPDDTAPVSVG